MEAIVQACLSEGWRARIAAVISNRPGAPGLRFAAERGLPTAVVDHKQFASRELFDAALAETIDHYGADVVALAGFMRILGSDFVQRYLGRLVNIHPSLLPAFTGLHTHRRAIETGCKLAGATVHLVTSELDCGPILVQAVVPILPGETEQTLSARVLAKEHLIYPRAVRWLVHDELRIEGSRVTHRGGAAQLLT